MRLTAVVFVGALVAACTWPIPPDSQDASCDFDHDAGQPLDAGRDAGVCGPCVSPPANNCNGSTLVVYASTGYCTEGACTYPVSDVSCPYGCANGECLAYDAGCGCTDDSQCPLTEYCAGNGCGTPGTCVPAPAICPDDCVPEGVCGCDGRTYCNACLAEQAGTRTAPTNACHIGPPRCVDDAQCPAGDYCQGSGCGTPGTCVPKPEVCPLYCTEPGVCGCDGRSYCNACLAERAGTRVDPQNLCHEPPDAGPPPCTSDSQCAAGQYCAGTGCGTAGTCVPRPDTCPDYCLDPGVCGCDGRLYCNECLAEVAGTRVDPQNLCLPPPCTTNAQCPSGDYCAGAGCGTPGTCEPLPGTCIADCLYPGVCGCDGRLYCNECVAEEAGTRVDPQNLCLPPPPDAGPPPCTSDSQCSIGQYCAGTGCGTVGTCEPVPQACPLACASPEVCGCDGRLYCNACLAEEAGTRVDPQSLCLPPPPDAGPTPCTTDSQCSIGEYCAGTGCGTAGTCEAIPEACPLYCVSPGVCGCDGRVYCNECLAEEAGTRLDPQSLCLPPPADAGPPDAGPTPCEDDAQCSTGEYCAGIGCGTPGTCEPLPGVCTEECVSPGVCGCDGHLYCNACLAEEAGTRVDPQNLCIPPPDAGPPPCVTDSQCSAGEYCAGTGCGTPGTCEPLPDGCPRSACVAPGVCGCNGQVYCNECYAELAGTRVDPQNLCLPPDAGTPDAGPPVCTSDAQCAAGQYCAGNGCNTPGTCQPIPTICASACAAVGVCGCDGRTYCNACLAEEAGTRVDATGSSCPNPPPLDAGPPPPTDAGSTCEILLQEFSADLSATQSCSQNSDCASEITPCGVVGRCSVIVNTSTEAEIGPILTQLEADGCTGGGPQCACVAPGTAVCSNGVCVAAAVSPQ
jgi:hypothetical protein